MGVHRFVADPFFTKSARAGDLWFFALWRSRDLEDLVEIASPYTVY